MFADFCRSSFIRQYAVVITVNLSVLSVGLGLAWTSPVLVKLRNETDPVLQRPITESEGAWIVSAPFLCGLIANFLAVLLVDRIGRKYCFILASMPRIICLLILTFTSEVWLVLVGRLFGGLSDGLTFAIVPTYASEIASNDIRGGLGTMLQIFSSLGILIMFCMGPFLEYYTLNTVFLIIAVLTSIPLFFLPDSPYYLHRKGKTDQCIKVLTFLRGSEEAAFEEIKEYSVNNEKVPLKEVLKSKTVLKSMAINIILGIGSQLTGFNAVQFYLQTILESTKTSVSSELVSVIIGVIQLIASLCTTMVIDKFGRKPIISCSLVGMAIGLLGLGTFFKIIQDGRAIVGFMNYLPLVSLVLVVFCYSGGLGALIWPLMSELFDGNARPIGVSTSLVFNIIAVFLTTRFFPALTVALGAATTYWVFCVNTIALLLFVMYCVPETKGRSFAEIQAAISGEKSDVDDKC